MREADRILSMVKSEGYEGYSFVCEAEQMAAKVNELEAALKRIGAIKWGYDGDCGAQAIVDEILE